MVMGIIVLILVFVVYKLAEGWTNLKEIKQCEYQYKEALKKLASNPNDIQIRQKALQAGRKYYASNRSGNKLTIYDESALNNDLLACTPANPKTNNEFCSDDELVFCKNCGKKVPMGKYCMGCGSIMNKEFENNSEQNCKLLLESAGRNSIKIIALVREVTGCGLKEAKDIVDNAPSIILNDIYFKKADEIRESFESNGAKMKIVSKDNYKVSS